MWRGMLKMLQGFFPTLEKELATVPAAERSLTGPKGSGLVTKLSTAGPTLRTEEGPQELRWAEVTPESVAALATKAFTGEKKDEHLKELLAAFAWAHRVRDAFWTAAMAVKSAQLTGPGADLVSALLAAAKDRFPK
jgi:hypothetical protein